MANETQSLVDSFMQIKKLKKLTDEKWLNLFAADYDNNGHKGRWVFASRKAKPHTGRSCDAVVMVPVLRNPKKAPRLVMIREFRVPIGDWVVGLPAGLVDEGETIEDTVKREMHEETGLTVTKIERVSPPIYSSAGLTDEAVAMAFVEVQGDPKAGPNLEPSESLQVMFLTYKEICKLLTDPNQNVDAKAWLVLLMLQRMGTLS